MTSQSVSAQAQASGERAVTWAPLAVILCGTFAVLAVGYLVTSLRAPALTIRFGRRVVAIGALVAALGDVALVLSVSGGPGVYPVAALIPGLFLLGAGQGLCITPLTTTVLAHASATRAGHPR